jgi:hypothetical protein
VIYQLAVVAVLPAGCISPVPFEDVDAVGCGTVLQDGRSRVRFPMVSLDCFFDIIFPAALWPWVDSASNRNEY